jgi:putative ABC transport system permease protein
MPCEELPEMALPFSYHWRSLFVRRTTTLLTVLVVAAVVAVFLWMVSFANALRTSLTMAGDPAKIIVLRRGSTSESNSAIPVDEAAKLNQLTELARDLATEQPLISLEIMVQVSLPRIRDAGKTNANVAVRGVTEMAFKVHRNVKLLDGMFSTSTPEVIVGLAASRQFAGLTQGARLRLGYGGNREYTIAGYFSADGGPMESEVWTYLPALMNAYNRSMYSSSYIRIQEGVDPEPVIEKIQGPAIQLNAMTESRYWDEQARLMRVYLKIAYVLVGMMCVAAVFSIANTMFSAVAGRTQEIAMLRTIGFSPRHILTGFVLEAVILALIGGAVGCVACAAWLTGVGNTKDMFGAYTFTTMAFTIQLTPWTVALALGAVALVGMIGSFAPALRAARLEVLTALREP